MEESRKKKRIRYFDYNLLFVIIFLMGFGLVMLYSSSSYTSVNKYGDSAHYLKLQIRNLLVGAVPMEEHDALVHKIITEQGIYNCLL